MNGAGSPVVEMSLADRVRAGDRAAEDELVQRFLRKVLLMARARVGDPQTAFDIAQETMIGVIEALRQGRVRDNQNVSGYVHGTAKNLINNHFRKRAEERTGESALDQAVARGDPEQFAIERERLEIVARVLSALKPDDREILHLTLVDGLKPGEIAVKKGLTSEVVRKRKSRATRRLVDAIRGLSRSRRPDHVEGDGR